MPVPVKQKKTEKCKHEHVYEIPMTVASEKTIGYNEEISKIPRPYYDDNRNIFHNPKKWKLIWSKEEVPSCISNSENDDEY